MTERVVQKPKRKLPSTTEVARAEEALNHVLAAAAADDELVVVGPWLAEVGFEVLDWIPFLRRLVEQGRLDPTRTVVISRGGVGARDQGSRRVTSSSSTR